jgi:hypothetical protein
VAGGIERFSGGNVSLQTIIYLPNPLLSPPPFQPEDIASVEKESIVYSRMSLLNSRNCWVKSETVNMFESSAVYIKQIKSCPQPK